MKSTTGRIKAELSENESEKTSESDDVADRLNIIKTEIDKLEANPQKILAIKSRRDSIVLKITGYQSPLMALNRDADSTLKVEVKHEINRIKDLLTKVNVQMKAVEAEVVAAEKHKGQASAEPVNLVKVEQTTTVVPIVADVKQKEQPPAVLPKLNQAADYKDADHKQENDLDIKLKQAAHLLKSYNTAVRAFMEFKPDDKYVKAAGLSKNLSAAFEKVTDEKADYRSRIEAVSEGMKAMDDAVKSVGTQKGFVGSMRARFGKMSLKDILVSYQSAESNPKSTTPTLHSINKVLEETYLPKFPKLTR